jgi:hemerythrin-like domain-containing protein
MNLLDALRGEHAVIRVLLAAVSRQTHERPAADLHPSFALLEEALASHASIEDALLFDRLLTTHRGIASALESMSEDHKSIRLQISELSRSPHEVFRTRYQRFADQVAEHFSLEERILFPLAADLVSQEELLQLGEEWARRRGLELGRASGEPNQPSDVPVWSLR